MTRTDPLQPPQPSPRTQPIAIVMGVSGSGKTTLARRLAEYLGWPFQEGDELHPRSNLEKLIAGEPLTDADRRPWLQAIRHWIDTRVAAGGCGTLSCSALRRHYRDYLRAGFPQVRFIHLDGSYTALSARLARRTGHFMPSLLLASQLETLQPPAPDECALVLDITLPLEEKVRRASAWLRQPAARADTQLRR